MSTFALNPRRRMTVAPDALEGYPLLIVDDLYRDPAAVRELALGLDYPVRRSRYPGAEACVEASQRELMALLSELTGEAFGFRVGPLPAAVAEREPLAEKDRPLPPKGASPARPPAPVDAGWAGSSYGSHAFFTVMTVPQDGGVPHVDAYDGILMTGLIYLNLPEQCRGGTALFRHRETGLVAVPAQEDADARAAMRKVGARTLGELWTG